MANKNKKGYPYIWAVPINTQFELENNVSAYIEVNDDFFYDKFEKKKAVKVNPYVRFNKIFTDFVNYYDNFFEIESKLQKDNKIKNLTKENVVKKESKISSFRRRKNTVDESREDKNEHILKNFKKNIEGNLDIYDCNENLRNEFQREYFDKKPKLNLFVEIKNFNEYSEDKVSFLISEIQNNYIEFECRGYLHGE